MSDADRTAGLDFMSETEIRAMLRGATHEKLLFGWCPYEWGGETYWVVTPPRTRASTYTTAGAADYCRMLLLAGVQPLYRTA